MAGEGVMLVPPYEPGTVAVATVRGEPNVRVMRRALDWAHDSTKTGLSCSNDTHVTDIRPLVVLDPTCEAVREFLEAHAKGGEPVLCSSQPVVDLITAQVKPPRIPEPGLWGVVEASAPGLPVRAKWVRMVTGPSDQAWLNDEAEWCDWEYLIDPVLIREGFSG